MEKSVAFTSFKNRRRRLRNSQIPEQYSAREENLFTGLVVFGSPGNWLGRAVPFD